MNVNADIPGAIKEIDRLTRTNASQRAGLLKYVGKLTDELVVQAMKQAETYFYENRKRYKQLSRPQLVFCGLIGALHGFRHADQTAIHRKCSEEDIKSIEEVHKARRQAAMLQRSKGTKGDELLWHLPDLVEFKAAGHSLRDLQAYLKQFNINVSHETIRRKLNEYPSHEQDTSAESA